MKAPELIAFLGPTLARDEAGRELRAATRQGDATRRNTATRRSTAARQHAETPLAFCIEPPARQGDIWRALARRPRALVLIDGLFESAPSVWHHELLDALDAGVLLFGAASMGALRARELATAGMIGVGAIFARYQGGLDDDAAVALLHGDEESGFVPLTVPLVNAEHALALAQAAGALTAKEARAMRGAASRLHYSERRWDAILEQAQLGPAARARWDAFASKGLPDLKADDARLCLREAAKAALARRHPGSRPHARVRAPRPSSRVRARRASQLVAAAGEANAGAQGEAQLQAQRTLFIAATARASGLAPSAAELAAAEAQLLPDGGAGSRERALLRAGLAEDELRALIETLALESLALQHARVSLGI